MTRLASGLERAGVRCDLVLGEQSGEAAAPPSVGLRYPELGESIGHVLDRYLQEGRPTALLPFRTTDFTRVTRAARARTSAPPVFLTTGTFIRERIGSMSRLSPRYWKARWRLRHQWPSATGILAVSPEVAEDWRRTGCFPTERIHAPPPPVVGPDVREASEQPLEHPWFAEGEPPVVLGVGRLHYQKGFDRLLNGFARLRHHCAARLVVLGQGEERGRLGEVTHALGLENAVDFPGFVDNPYNWMRRAAVVVAPSRTETFGFALVESLYLGTPFVADAGPPGPRSIQRATGEGELVDSDDADALAAAIERVFDRPPAPERLCAAAEPFDSEQSARAYLAIVAPRDGYGG